MPIRGKPLKGNTPVASTSKLECEFALLANIPALGEASCTPSIRITQLQEAESTVDQLGACALEGIQEFCNNTVIVPMLRWDTYS